MLIASSCEEVIEVDLNSASPVLVADGLIVKDSVSWIRLSYTTDYFNSTQPAWVSDARVVLHDDAGNSELLNYYGNGLYKGSGLKGKGRKKLRNVVYIKGISLQGQFNALSACCLL